MLKGPLAFSKGVADFGADLIHFQQNAQENRTLRKRLAQLHEGSFRTQELSLENERLRRLLDLRPSVPTSVYRQIHCRVIARSPLAWNRVLLLDKGTRDGVRPHMLVLSELAVIGKVLEVGVSVSKVILITDSNCKIGVLIQRTREGGVLFGVLSQGCRMKYIPINSTAQPGDVVETAGIGGYFPKGIQVGSIERIWKEPAQMYQVAQIRPAVDLGRVEEVLCVD